MRAFWLTLSLLVSLLAQSWAGTVGPMRERVRQNRVIQKQALPLSLGPSFRKAPAPKEHTLRARRIRAAFSPFEREDNQIQELYWLEEVEFEGFEALSATVPDPLALHTAPRGPSAALVLGNRPQRAPVCLARRLFRPARSQLDGPGLA